MAQISPQLIEAITKEVIKALGEFPRAQEPTVCTGQIPVLVLEGYVQRLREFDIKIGSLAEIENWLSCRPASPKASSAAKGPSKVLCAREAQELINGAADGKIKLPGGTMITPLARDVLRGYEIEFI